MCLSDSPVKVLLTEKSRPSLKVPGKGASPPCSPKRDPYGNRCPFSEPYLTYPSGSPVEPSLQFPLTELPQREMFNFQSSPHLFQGPWQINSPPSSPLGPVWRERFHLQCQWLIHSFISHRVPG